MAWKQARWPPLSITFLTSPCTVMTPYQVSSEIYGGFFYSAALSSISLSCWSFLKSRRLWDLTTSSLQHILTYEAMKVAGKAWQRSRWKFASCQLLYTTLLRMPTFPPVQFRHSHHVITSHLHQHFVNVADNVSWMRAVIQCTKIRRLNTDPRSTMPSEQESGLDIIYHWDINIEYCKW